MRALFVEVPGRPPQLVVRDVAIPTPGPGEVLVKVEACGFCHHDLSVMAGVLRRGVAPGVILGHEISGVIAEVGPKRPEPVERPGAREHSEPVEGAAQFKEGDRVVSILTAACGTCDRCIQGREHRCRVGKGIGHGRNGGFAEYCVMPEFSLVPVPDDVDLTQAALLACPIGVSLQAIRDAAQVGPGDTVVVTGAGGGLGIHSVQVAASLGARVLAVTSSLEKLGNIAPLGGEEILHTPELPFSEMALALTEDQGADAVIDTVGSPLFPFTWQSLSQYGRLALLGEVGGRPVELNLAEIIFKDAGIRGSSGASKAVVEQAAGMVARWEIQPVVSQTFALEDAPAAFELLAGRSVLGRLVFKPGG